MTRDQIKEIVVSVVAEQLAIPEEEVTEERPFMTLIKKGEALKEEDSGHRGPLPESLNADSLDVVEIIMELEEKFNLKIPDEEAEGLKTIADAVDYILKRLEDPGSTGQAVA